VADIYISLTELSHMSDQLATVIDEFKNSVEKSEALESAIGAPFLKSELREKAEDFETRWDLKRDELQGGLEEIKKHLDGVIKGFQEADIEMAISLSEEKN